MKRLLPAALPLFLGLIPCATRAVDAAPFTLNAAIAQHPPAIDGTLNDPEWKTAAHAQLNWDIAFLRPAEEQTDAYLLADSRYIYVAFVAKQREPITATVRTNDQPLGADDVVRVYFFPAGNSGNEYGFVANPAGTRYSFSSENTAYAPVWQVVAKTTPDGYVVTERIPVGVMRGDGRATWRIQFDRRVHSNNEIFEWAQNPGQQNSDSTRYLGYLNNMKLVGSNTRTKPRLGLYALGEAADPAAGGSTSRAGADFSVPVTPTASFIGTIHPDYSNVELDQQTISPTAFARRYSEVRPFFTQGSQFYNAFNCNDCFDYPLLYTPGIPTPRDGYALEGKQEQYTFGSFDAVGDARDDTAESLQWRSVDRADEFAYQRESVDMPGVHDVAQFVQPVIGDYHNFSAYATLGDENGTQVTNPYDGHYREYGINLFNAKSGVFAAYHDIGSQFDPIDSYFQINDVHGPTVYAFKEFDFGPQSAVQSVEISNDWGEMRNHLGQTNDAYVSPYITVQTRNNWFLGVSAGYNYLLLPGTPGGYNNQNGASLSYNVNGSTPSSISYYAGRFADAYLHSTDLKGSWRVTRLGTIGVEAYQTLDSLDSGGTLTQWLERASFAYQLSPGQSVALGWRRIIGTAPPFFSAPTYLNATNVSAAYYRRWNGNELYFAFGDPNQVYTQHSVILKLIRYIGADKGT